ncbi:MAG TPA: BRCT domain-containing protein [Candidatus Corynebacterium gallistercoris]|uniref:BRCT domain-containing protein n=1 Tax=Candidatus Corynebacterium gallistercoris TaxID=2838530 RepID=A0A9D1RZI8_9CORY|nr:BRCT domain-containing protein [Candidatus Corynebacterium gallistercoris]
MHARGAEVVISRERIEVRRSPLASSLWPDVDRDPADLVGWYKQAPGQGSTGFIDLLFGSDATRINFSPTDREAYEAIDHRLMLLQAGYDLDEVSEDEWVASAEVEAETVASEASPSEEPAKASRAPWSKVATPDEVPEPNEKADIDGPIYGQVVCVTGDVEPYDKGEVWDMIASRGGTVGKNVTKKTTMLIVGEWASVTSKEKRARELKDQGQDISIIQFKDFLNLLSLK